MVKRIELDSAELVATIFGTCDGHADLIADVFGVRLRPIDDGVAIVGDEETVERVAAVIAYLRKLALRGEPLTAQVLDYAVALAREGEIDSLEKFGSVKAFTKYSSPY